MTCSRLTYRLGLFALTGVFAILKPWACCPATASEFGPETPVYEAANDPGSDWYYSGRWYDEYHGYPVYDQYGSDSPAQDAFGSETGHSYEYDCDYEHYYWDDRSSESSHEIAEQPAAKPDAADQHNEVAETASPQRSVEAAYEYDYHDYGRYGYDYDNYGYYEPEYSNAEATPAEPVVEDAEQADDLSNADYEGGAYEDYYDGYTDYDYDYNYEEGHAKYGDDYVEPYGSEYPSEYNDDSYYRDAYTEYDEYLATETPDVPETSDTSETADTSDTADSNTESPENDEYSEYGEHYEYGEYHEYGPHGEYERYEAYNDYDGYSEADYFYGERGYETSTETDLEEPAERGVYDSEEVSDGVTEEMSYMDDLDPFTWLPSDLLQPADKDLLRTLNSLFEEPGDTRELVLNGYIEGLGLDAVEFVSRFEEANEGRGIALHDDLPGVAAVLAAYRMVEQGELGMDESLESLTQRFNNLSREWIEDVSFIVTEAPDDRMLQSAPALRDQNGRLLDAAVAASGRSVGVISGGLFGAFSEMTNLPGRVATAARMIHFGEASVAAVRNWIVR